MHSLKKLISLLLVTLLCVTLLPSCFAQEGLSETAIVREMVCLYSRFPEASRPKINTLLGYLKEKNPDEYEKWSHIMAYWDEANNRMKINPGKLPDDLSDSEHLCIVVLGFQLNPDGSMQKELLGRLETALTCANQYPKAWILCTGGPTGQDDVTEAGAMADWLEENGISRDRIIQEGVSLSTTENAQNCCAILRSNYPEITSLAIVSSDYHIPWAAVLFETQCVLAGDTARVVSNAAAAGPEQIHFGIRNAQRDGILRIAGIRF